jgi:hypothetical protein
MSRWEDAPEVLALARELGVEGDAPVDGILDHCRRRIDGWVAEAGGISSTDALESLVTRRLQMVFEEIRTGEDFDRLTEKYARGMKEFVFAAMRAKFNDDANPTYGALVQRRNAILESVDRFVAVIDCRGNKLARRFFTRWHEIAHRLTTHTDIPEPVYRSEHDPIERLMDEIAGHVGFYEPIFVPAFRRANLGSRILTFSMVQAVVSEAFPAASFQAALFACARRLPTPIVYLEASIAHNKEGRQRLATRSLFADDPPPGELRAVTVVQNEAAQKEKFAIPKNMRVPLDSVICRVFCANSPADEQNQEDLSQWESKGKSLDRRVVIVECRKIADRVIAIVQPVEEKRRQERERRKPLFSAHERSE